MCGCAFKFWQKQDRLCTRRRRDVCGDDCSVDVERGLCMGCAFTSWRRRFTTSCNKGPDILVLMCVFGVGARRAGG